MSELSLNCKVCGIPFYATRSDAKYCSPTCSSRVHHGVIFQPFIPDDPSETWLSVVGYEGLYEVSDKGRVRSLPRPATQGKLLKSRPHKRTGHLRVYLSRNGTEVDRKVHHLVLEAFVGPKPDGMIGCHRNDIADDNRLENLKWDTHSGNNFDTVRNGNHWHARKTCCPKCGGPYDLAWKSRGRRCSRCTKAAARRRYVKSRRAS